MSRKVIYYCEHCLCLSATNSCQLCGIETKRFQAAYSVELFQLRKLTSVMNSALAKLQWNVALRCPLCNCDKNAKSLHQPECPYTKIKEHLIGLARTTGALK